MMRDDVKRLIDVEVFERLVATEKTREALEERTTKKMEKAKKMKKAAKAKKKKYFKLKNKLVVLSGGVVQLRRVTTGMISSMRVVILG